MTGTTAVWGFVLLVGAAALLTIGAELFAENATAASRRLGVSALAIGLILAGAEPEELLTAIFAAAQHHPGIAAGDAIGANITMLTLVLGLAVVFRPIRSGGLFRTYAVVAAAAGVAAVLALLGGGVGRLAGGLLVACYALIVGVIWRRERRPPMFGELAELADDDDDDSHESSPRQRRAVLLLLGGLALMILGGPVAVAGAERIVGSLGMAESVVGLTFVALATTAELFALVWAAARRRGACDRRPARFGHLQRDRHPGRGCSGAPAGSQRDGRAGRARGRGAGGARGVGVGDRTTRPVRRGTAARLLRGLPDCHLCLIPGPVCPAWASR